MKEKNDVQSLLEELKSAKQEMVTQVRDGPLKRIYWTAELSHPQAAYVEEAGTAHIFLVFYVSWYVITVFIIGFS